MLEIKSLYRILEENSNKIVIKLNTCEHPIFKAHFPNHPILPGFCHIEILSNILKDKITKIKLLKLQQKTLPKDTITYVIDTNENNRKIKILNNDKLIGKLEYEY